MAYWHVDARFWDKRICAYCVARLFEVNVCGIIGGKSCDNGQQLTHRQAATGDDKGVIKSAVSAVLQPEWVASLNVRLVSETGFPVVTGCSIRSSVFSVYWLVQYLRTCEERAANCARIYISSIIWRNLDPLECCTDDRYQRLECACRPLAKHSNQICPDSYSNCMELLCLCANVVVCPIQYIDWSNDEVVYESGQLQNSWQQTIDELNKSHICLQWVAFN